jgi:hypothetical protein
MVSLLFFLLQRMCSVFKGGEETICFDKITKMPWLMLLVSSSSIYSMFSTLVKPFQATIDMKFVPHMKQYVWRFLIKFQPNPTVGLRYIIDTVKLDNQCLLR